MSTKSRSRLKRYGGAVIAVVLATLVRMAIDPVLGDARPLVTYLAAIMFSAWAFGSGPTLLAVALSLTLAVYFFFPPRHSFALDRSADLVGCLVFLVFGLVAGLFSEQLFRTSERSQWRQRQAEIAQELQRAHDELEKRVVERTLELTRANLNLSREVEERRTAESRLREQAKEIETLMEVVRGSEERFQAFMDHLPAGAWILDEHSRCLFVNRLYSTMTGLDVGCIVGKTAYDLYPPEIAVQHQNNDRLALEIGTGLEVEEPYIRQDGTPGELLVVKFPIMERGNLLRIGGVALDVTERKRAEVRMRRLAAELATAEDTERRRLATDLHDSIGQSLFMLKMYLESLARPKVAADLPGAAAATDSASCADGSFSTSLDFSNSLALLDNIIKQTRTLMLELYPSMLHDLGLVPTLFWYSEQLGTQAQVTISEIGKSQPILPPLASYLFRAIKEVMSNALRHGRANEIVVAVHWRHEALKVVVDDDGCGFDPVTVLAPQTQRGLGLAGIQERLASFSGKMLIESDPGRGSRIIMEVPLQGTK